MGRGVLFRGRWAEHTKHRSRSRRCARRFLCHSCFPTACLACHTVRAFNCAVLPQPRPHSARGPSPSFFYPLDVRERLARGYGPAGFTQYQCVLPASGGHGAARRFLEVVPAAEAGIVPVRDQGLRSRRGRDAFVPQARHSIALDLAVRDDTQASIDQMNECVISEGGRIYLAKDAMTRPEHFRAMERAGFRGFSKIRRAWDPDGRIRSAQSVRLFGW